MENRKPKKKKTGWIILLVLVVLAALAVVGYMFNYNAARQAAGNGEYERAKATLFAPGITEKHDPLLLDYIDAGLLLEQEDYIGAAAAFQTLAEQGYLDSRQKLDGIRETIYPLAIAMYRDGDTTPVADAYLDRSAEAAVYTERNSLCYRYLQILGGYRDADRYSILCRAAAGDLNDQDYELLVSDLDFENTKELLVKHINVAERFLLGIWFTRDGKTYFEMKKDGDTAYNLPFPYNDDDKYFYSITDGLYFNYLREADLSSLTQEDMEEGAFFDIEVIDEDCIRIYCYTDKETYTLYRQKA